MNLERATDLDRVARLCRAAGLPTDDLHEAPATFYLGRDGGRVVAVGGIEDCGDAGLLRSVTVTERERGEGYGTAMTEALVERARDDYDALYLLTTDAADFFAGQGFERVEREAAPDAVRETTQFSDLCPASAVVMRRSL